MTLDIQNNLPLNSRVWIYQSNRILTNEETAKAQEIINGFLPNWKSHGKELEAAIELYHNLFIVVFANEAAEAPSGCSIDSSVGMIKQIQSALNIDLFDRLTLAYIKDDQIALCKLFHFEEKLKSGELNAETLVFNNLVSSKEMLISSWLTPVKNSWHNQLLPKIKA
ncbi:MAG: ABC transporter ATPase [Bacteroidetes bacterium]|nr:ABC transporter ATPase [Bacteroidota bacterium]